MSVRIRYSASDVGEAFKKSKKIFKAGKHSFYVVLNEDSMHYMIFNADTREVVASGGNTTNKTVLRLQAKKALETLGVKFEGESRRQLKSVPTPQSEAPQASASEPAKESDTSDYVRRDEVMAIVELKVKELLNFIQSTKQSQPTQESSQQAEMVS